MKCPICNDVLYPFDYSNDYLICKNCDVLISIKSEEKYSQNYYFFTKSHKSRHKKILNILKNLKLLKGKILDFGCGTGDFMEIVKNKFSMVEIWGYDISKYAIKLAKDKKLKVFENLNQLIEQSEKFDLILMLDVIEHLENIHSILEIIYNLLKKEGKVFLTTPNKNSKYSLFGKENWHGYAIPQYHRIIFSIKGLVKLMELHNFKILTIYTTPPIVNNFYEKMRLLLASFGRAEKTKLKKLLKIIGNFGLFIKTYFNNYLEDDTIIGVFYK